MLFQKWFQTFVKHLGNFSLMCIFSLTFSGFENTELSRFGNLRQSLVASTVAKSAVLSMRTSCKGEWSFTVILFWYFAMVAPPSDFYGNLKMKKKRLVASTVAKAAVSSRTSCKREWSFAVILFWYFAIVAPPSDFLWELKNEKKG